MSGTSRTAVAVLEKVSLICFISISKKISDNGHFIRWFSSKADDQNTVVGALLKPHPVAPVLDASPFFLRQYLKGHYADMFEQYAQLLTEIVIRLPYQVQKHASIQATFEQVC